jgi:hypothetical protein
MPIGVLIGALLGLGSLARGVTPEWLGLWWVHVSVIALSAAILLVPRFLSRVRYRRNVARLVPA